MDGDGSAALVMQSGFGNEFASEAIPGALPIGRNSPQRPPLGLYAEQFSGTAFTVPRHEARRTWLYRIRPSAAASARIAASMRPRARALAAPTPNRLRWDPLPIPEQPTDFVAGLATMLANAAGAGAAGVTRARLPRQPLDAARVLERRRRAADRAAARAAGARHRMRPAGRGAGRDRRHAARHALPRGAAGRRRRAAMSARTTARCCGCPSLARSAPTGWPIRATSSPLSPWFEDRDEPTEVVQKFMGELWATDARPFAARRRRLARQLRALQIRPGALQHHRHGQLRPSRPVDLHGADRAHRHARPRQHGFRHLPAALDGGRGYVPAALVPPQRDERVHGPGARRLRCQGRRASCPAASACTA